MRPRDEVHDPGPQLPLQTIGSFARSVGLSPSALRDYGDRGLLRPTDVEQHNGYRYYDPAQQRQAIWIRRLRDAGMGLDRIRTVLEGGQDQSDAVLDAWVAEARAQSVSREELVADLRSTLRVVPGTSPVQRTGIRLDGATLRIALRQVARAGSAAGFDGILLETGIGAVSVAATDRYVLLARTGVPAAIDGPPTRVRIPRESALEWLSSCTDVRLTIERPAGGATTRVLLSGSGDDLALDGLPDVFPQVAGVIDADAARRSRLVFETAAVLELLAPSHAPDVALVTSCGTASLRRGDRSVSGRAIGDEVAAISLSPRSLGLVADAVVGQQLVCDLRDGDRPLLWRDPAQPDFAALMMSSEP